MKLLFPSVVAFALALPLAAQVDENVLQVHDLGPLRAEFDASSSWRTALVVEPADPYGQIGAPPLAGLHERAGVEAIVDLVSQMLGDELRYEGRRFSLEGGDRLVVLAPPAIHASIRAALAALETAVAAASIELTVDVVTLTGAEGDWPTNNVVDPGVAERMIASLVGRGAAHASYALQLGAGRTTSLDLGNGEPFVYDYDVEIAHGAHVFDPVVLDAAEGTRILLRGTPTRAGVALSVVLRCAERVKDVFERPVRLRGLVRSDEGGVSYVEGPQVIQSVETLVRSEAFDTFVPQGKSIVIACQTELAGSKSHQLVFVRRTGGTLQPLYSIQLGDSARRLVLLNSELLSPPRTSIELERTLYHPLMVARLDTQPSLFLFDWMKNRFSIWRRLGPWALAVTDPAWDDGAAATLDEMLGGWEPEVELLSLELALRDAHGSTPLRVSLPVRSGTSCGSLVGITSTALVDYDVEVAQNSAVADPVMRPTFSGLALSMEPASRQGGEVSLDLRGQAQLALGPLESLDLAGNLATFVDRPRYDRMEIEGRVTFALGAGRPARAVVGNESSLRLELSMR